MNTTSTCKSFATVFVGAAMLVLFLGTGTAHAKPRNCHVQADPAACPGSDIGIGSSNEHRTPGIDPGSSVGLGGPDTMPPQHN